MEGCENQKQLYISETWVSEVEPLKRTSPIFALMSKTSRSKAIKDICKSLDPEQRSVVRLLWVS